MASRTFEVTVKNAKTGKTEVKTAVVAGGDYDEDQLKAHFVVTDHFRGGEVMKVVAIDPPERLRMSQVLANIKAGRDPIAGHAKITPANEVAERTTVKTTKG